MSRNIFLRRLGKRLKEAREKKGYNKKDLAELLSVEVRTVEKYEQGVIDMPVSKIYKVCKFLNICVVCSTDNTKKERRKFKG